VLQTPGQYSNIIALHIIPFIRKGGQEEEWLYDHGGLKIEDRDAFKKSIDAFRKTGNLQLPV
jgi:hypothetical protein